MPCRKITDSGSAVVLFSLGILADHRKRSFLTVYTTKKKKKGDLVGGVFTVMY